MRLQAEQEREEGPSGPTRRRSDKSGLKAALVVGVVIFLLIQLVPYGWRHPNPPVVEDAPWPTGSAAELARVACYDCHSNETDWPFYSYVAPSSWLSRRDVEQGRDELKFSRWDRDAGEADDAIEVLLDGSMPPDRYTILHPDASLSDAEVRELVTALEQMERDDDEDDEEEEED